ncbi:hypothetical protein SAMN02746041_01995 [Desulfacinum hydrothermale DSM 13146]|uniref:DUF2062 domain-containing protein n=1 Tax=Desulfacinum hydrothermale DSM 13146 TaxID=1121390 RepID=A0A1W1XKU8_9BACT|nr:DUF2062 domain-containing protein [Desulfacinum hydrothermale]SMC24437.1 hypothetical protein SAMN02746041_01995 [Desulfacinum hydrothermale DSM 13146]
MNEKLRRFSDRFVRIHGDPHEIALGFSLGIFVGLSPTLGVQMVLAALLAALLGWNKIAAAAGVWITNPFTAPFIYPFTYWVGARLLSLGKSAHQGTALQAKGFLYVLEKMPHVLGAMTVGGIVVGLPLAVLGYWLALRAVTGYREKVKTRLSQARQRLRQERAARKAERRSEGRGGKAPSSSQRRAP